MELRRLINDDGDYSDNDTYWITSIQVVFVLSVNVIYCIYIWLFFGFFQLFCIYKLAQANV